MQNDNVKTWHKNLLVAFHARTLSLVALIAAFAWLIHPFYYSTITTRLVVVSFAIPLFMIILRGKTDDIFPSFLVRSLPLVGYTLAVILSGDFAFSMLILVLPLGIGFVFLEVALLEIATKELMLSSTNLEGIFFRTTHFALAVVSLAIFAIMEWYHGI